MINTLFYRKKKSYWTTRWKYLFSFIICLSLISFVSAVWYNPLTWFGYGTQGEGTQDVGMTYKDNLDGSLDFINGKDVCHISVIPVINGKEVSIKDLPDFKFIVVEIKDGYEYTISFTPKPTATILDKIDSTNFKVKIDSSNCKYPFIQNFSTMEKEVSLPSIGDEKEVKTQSFSYTTKDDITEITLNSKHDIGLADRIYIDPIITINAIISSGSSLLTNVRREENFTHLMIGNVEPYKNLTMYVPFDMDNNITSWDFSTNDVDGTYSGATTTSGVYGNGLVLDGINDYIVFPSSTLDLTANLTISTWIKPNPAKGIIYANRYRYNSNEYGYILSMNNTGALIFATGDSANNNEAGQAFSTTSIANNVWTHVAVTRSGNSTSFYINGALVNTKQTKPKTIAYLSTINGRYLSFCNDTYTGSTTYDFADTRYLNGTLDDFMIFNSSLSSTDIASIYQNTSSRFYGSGNQTLPSQNISAGYNRVNLTTTFSSLLGSSVSGRVGFWQEGYGYNETRYTNTLARWTGDNTPNSTNGNYNGTLMGGTTYGTGIYNTSFVFDGDGDYINFTNPFRFWSSNLTFSVWIKSSGNNLSASVTGQMIMGTYGFFPGPDIIVGEAVLFSDNAYGTEDGFIINIFGSNMFSYLPGINLTDNRWHHFIYSQDGTSSFSYIDGFLATQSGYDSRPPADYSSPLETYIAYGYNNADVFGQHFDFNGSIDDLIIINRSLTNAEAQKLYIEGLAKYNYTAYQTLTTGQNSTFNVTTTTVRVIPDLKLDAGTNNFYTPIVYGSVLIDYFNVSEGGAPPVTDTSFTVTLPVGTTIAIYNFSNGTQKNLMPQNQTSLIPFLNITNAGNVDLNFSLYLNSSLDTGISLKANTNSTTTITLNITTTSQIISQKIQSGGTFAIWFWSDISGVAPKTIYRGVNVSSSQ